MLFLENTLFLLIIMAYARQKTCHKNIFYCVMQHKLCHLQSHLIITQPVHSRNLKPAIIAKTHEKVVFFIFEEARPRSFPPSPCFRAQTPVSRSICKIILTFYWVDFIL